MTKNGKRALRRRIHSLAAVGPLGLYLVFHLWQNWAALHGRQAWLERTLQVKTPVEFELLFLLCISFSLHAALGWGKSDSAGLLPVGTPGLGLLQRLTGLGALLFLLLHLYQVWFQCRGERLLCSGPYDSMRAALGSPPWAVLYAAGVTIVYFHFAHGLSRAAVFWGLARTENQLRAARWLAGVVGFALWILTLHVLGCFVVGQGLFVW